jgi:hypothetical protein
MPKEELMQYKREAGRGTLGCLVGVAVALWAVIAGIRVIPVKVNVMDLKKFAEMQAEQASLPQHDDEFIVNQIFQKARLLQLPLPKESIRVRRDMGSVFVDYEFTVVLKLPLYTYNWRIEEHIERKLF